ncbi:helicase-2 [Pseudalatia unipuncta granulovirus]|uniref:Helicase-2 n=1 Tax=Pseudalatia unipuncta granulosis virus TaxID=36355 RepID=B6S722_GVPU|nr:helicase-2 [Pseudalatia unipuncta granulovirus]ACH69503.1 helicase-2 [Pseudalatia unipuncta granulovirus]
MKRQAVCHEKQQDTKRICRLDAPAQLNEQQQRIFDYVTQRSSFEPIFVSGSAGTGKSALLKSLRTHWINHKKIVWVVSFTNLAARNVDGQTIHKQFGFDFKCNLNNGNRHAGAPNYFILDEVSMVPSKMLQNIHTFFQQNTRLDLPFGGVNTIIFGDLYQLPPISNQQCHQLPPYCADIWKSLSLYHLTMNMRQSESDFIEALNLLRVGDKKCLEFFDQKVMDHNVTIEDQFECTSLVPTHREADYINSKCYGHIKTISEEPVVEYILNLSVRREPRRMHLMVYGSGQEELIFRDKLKYCVGTRVMITHNLKGLSFCNGNIGTVMDIDELGVLVKRECDGIQERINMVEIAFETEKYNTVKVVTGLPMCYAWAVTIHKAQGMTVKNLIVHPLNIFAKGQAYVALSRVTHCEGLRLVNKIPAECIMKMSDVDKVYTTQDLLTIDNDGFEEEFQFEFDI